MTSCREVRLLMMEAQDPTAGEVAAEHAESCAECRRLLANERLLRAGLAAMNQASPDTPLHVKASLMAEFRSRRPRKATRVWPGVIGIAAAAALLLFGMALRRERRKAVPVAQKQVPAHIVSGTEAPPLKNIAIARTKKKSSGAVRRPKVAVPAAPPRSEESPEVATGFFEIPFTEPLRPEQRADVFRVQMPRASMAVFGLPVTGGQLDTRVLADVVVGEDGVARAVRFIR